MKKEFPKGMVPLGRKQFRFACHEKVACFTRCCKGVEMVLYPYDILRLRAALQLEAEDFLHRHARLVQGENPYFPTVMLKLDERGWCPFLLESGCSVYAHRPSACRTYPLERAVDRNPGPGEEREYYFLTRHDYCLGHEEEDEITVRQWIRGQQLDRYNMMNDLWGELDTIFATNPWKGEGAGGERQRLAFLVCYDIDGFREFVVRHGLLEQFRLDRDWRRRIEADDAELQKFGFEWLKLLLTGKSTVLVR